MLDRYIFDIKIIAQIFEKISINFMCGVLQLYIIQKTRTEKYVFKQKTLTIFILCYQTLLCTCKLVNF